MSIAKKSRLDDAIKEINSELSNVMTDIQTTSKAHRVDVNGIDAITVEGVGKINDVPVTWGVDLLDAKRPVFVITFGRADSWSDHLEEYANFAKSVQRV